MEIINKRASLLVAEDRCPSPVLPDNVIAAVCSDQHNVRSACEFICDDGYEAAARVKVTCLTSGEWTVHNGTACEGQ